MDSRFANSIRLGNGQPVILIHGLAASLYEWSSLAPALASHGFTAYALDLLGHGKSAKPDDPRLYHIESIYQHFKDWLDSLSLDIPPVLIGHSLGGYLSLLHAIRLPQAVQCLVLIDPFFESGQLSLLLHMASRRPTLGEKTIRLTPQWLIHAAMGLYPGTSANFPKKERLRVAIDCKRASPYFVYITHDMPDLTGRLPEVNAPVLVIWGERDQSLKPDSFQRLVRILPNAVGYPVSATGHQPHISQPELVARLTLEFLAQWNASGELDRSSSAQVDGDRLRRS